MSWVFANLRNMAERQAMMEDSREINLLLFQYANDHDGNYPVGKTSTEVFQKLIDAGYVSDSSEENPKKGAAIFYEGIPGKIEPTSKILKPENVCWDVTIPVKTVGDAESLPVLFLSGYRITYGKGVKALPRTWPTRTWSEWRMNLKYPKGFIVVGYKSDNEKIIKADPDGSISIVAPVDFNADGKTYHQLTPDGSIP